MNTQSAIVEIRAGTGGDEAALFVTDLFTMYSKYAQQKGWGLKTTNESLTPLGGYTFSSFEITGENAYDLLQHEGGVHRVQRIPKTEKSGRVHTSTATVAVFKKGDKKETRIDTKDLRIDFFRSSGPGGQYTNKRETAVRITHLPTGTVVESQDERSQQANRESAMKVLEKRIAERVKKQISSKQQEVRREQIGTAERAEKIRTYNFPQNRLTDHRIKKSWHNLDAILNGNLDKVIKKIAKEISQ